MIVDEESFKKKMTKSRLKWFRHEQNKATGKTDGRVAWMILSAGKREKVGWSCQIGFHGEQYLKRFGL